MAPPGARLPALSLEGEQLAEEAVLPPVTLLAAGASGGVAAGGEGAGGDLCSGEEAIEALKASGAMALSKNPPPPSESKRSAEVARHPSTRVTDTSR